MRIAWYAAYALTLAAQPVMAQSAPSRPDPADPNASVPPANYRSAFAAYRGWRDEKLSNWRSANDVVGEIGGWRVYAREAQQPDPTPARQSPQQPSDPTLAPASKQPTAHPPGRGQ